MSKKEIRLALAHLCHLLFGTNADRVIAVLSMLPEDKLSIAYLELARSSDAPHKHS